MKLKANHTNQKVISMREIVFFLFLYFDIIMLLVLSP